MKKGIKRSSKVLVGIMVDKIETFRVEKGGYDFEFLPYMGLRYNLCFSDGSVLSLWEGDYVCPSGYEPCAYGYWEWTEGKPSNKWGMKPLEVEVREGREGDCDDVVVSLRGSGDRVASVSKDGGDGYYPCGEHNLGFEGFYAKPGYIVWALRGLEEEYRKNIANSLELKNAQDLEKRDQEKILVLGKEVSISDVERHLKEGEKLIEVQFVD